MAAVDRRRIQFAVPNICNVELASFFESHFSDVAVQNFTTKFLEPEERRGARGLKASHDGDDSGQEHYYEEDNDGLGYYPDGVKRTLTDEQIAIFRHSEIESLRKEQEKAAELHATPQQKLETGEVGDDVNTNDTPHQLLKTKNKKKRKAGKSKKHEHKPDLRKRTWDIVEAGLDSLDYD